MASIRKQPFVFVVFLLLTVAIDQLLTGLTQVVPKRRTSGADPDFSARRLSAEEVKHFRHSFEMILFGAAG